jgi:hypothetical protein
MTSKAPDWAHRLLDLCWGIDQKKIQPGEPLHAYMPIGGIKMWQESIPGAVFGAACGGYSRPVFGVDFRDSPDGVWKVTMPQPQPEPVPAITLSLDEWLAGKGKT